ncbi:hypothetical protein ACFS6H_16680 [Terrimonas rubra]|uniref:Bacteroides conjugative transposon TraK protein n=1 Tax=Terrimonas rubra TaxID=1035890 RepID=A0ABW6A7L7_9BACT
MKDKNKKEKLPPRIIITTDKPIHLEIDSNDLSEMFKETDDNIWTRKTRLNLAFQIIIIAVTAYSIYIAHKSWISSVYALAKSDTAQQKSTEQFLLVNKPFVTLSNFEWLDIYGPDRLTAAVNISNLGNHVARLFQYNYALSQVEYGIDSMMKTISNLKHLEKNLYLVKESAYVTSSFPFNYFLDPVTKTNIKNGCTVFYVLLLIDYEALIDGKKYRNILYLRTFGKDMRKAEMLKNETILL